MQSARPNFLTHVFSLIFCFIKMADDHDGTLLQFFKELPILVEKATRNIHSSNKNLLEYSHRKLLVISSTSSVDPIYTSFGRTHFNDTHSKKLCFTRFTTRMTAWLFLTFVMCLHNQLSSIHFIIIY